MAEINSEQYWKEAAAKLLPGDIIEYQFHGKETTLCVVVSAKIDTLKLKLIFAKDEIKADYDPDEEGHVEVRGVFPHKLLSRVRRDT